MSASAYGVLTAISWTFTGLAILLTAGRFWIRCKIIKRLSWEDAAHLLGLLLLIAQVSVVSANASLVYRVMSSGTTDNKHYESVLLENIRLNVAGMFVTWCCLYAIKMSFMLLYYHIFRIFRTFIQAWWIVLAIVVLTFLILIAGTLTQCGSPSALEDVGSCLTPSMIHRQTEFVIYSCVLNVFSDLTIMALPLAMLKGLQMRTPVKVGLAGVFCCAFITIGFDILRAIETEKKTSSTALWTNLESAVAVIVSCLPSFTALFSPKNKRNDGKNRAAFRQRSLVILYPAKLCVRSESYVKSGCSGQASASGEMEKSIVTFGEAMSASNVEKSEGKSISIV